MHYDIHLLRRLNLFQNEIQKQLELDYEHTTFAEKPLKYCSQIEVKAYLVLLPDQVLRPQLLFELCVIFDKILQKTRQFVFVNDRLFL